MNKIIGNPLVTPMRVPDWNQTDERKSDYIKNKPNLDAKANKDDVYTKAETDAKLDEKANTLKKTVSGEHFTIIDALPNRTAKGRIFLSESANIADAFIIVETTVVVQNYKIATDGTFEFVTPDATEWVVYIGGHATTGSTLEFSYVVADLSTLKEEVDALKSDMGDIETALDGIIAQQENYIGGAE